MSQSFFLLKMLSLFILSHSRYYYAIYIYTTIHYFNLNYNDSRRGILLYYYRNYFIINYWTV